ncbi:MAG TPA: thioredoxin domain-containing protein, partial [Polyangiaceae bacterium]
MALAAGLFRLAQGRVRGVSPGLLAVFSVWFLLVAGPSCSPATHAHTAQAAPSAGQSSESLSLASAPDRPEHALAKVPVTPADPQWGNVDAPVTLVEVSDFECPFCARVQPTLEALKRHYGPQQLRLVWKHRPLPFHQSARPAHEVAAAVQMLAGSTAFFAFHDRAFANQRALSRENLELWSAQVGVERQALQTWLDSGKPAHKVADDIALADSIGAFGTPAFRINGVTLAGAQPLEAFTQIIDEQLTAAKQLSLAGTPARQLYPLLTAKNYVEPTPTKDEPEPEDTTLWNVPVLPGDPVLGPADALVTIVQFSEYQCPYCKRVEETLAQLSKQYAKDVRIVWKDSPLPFHERALPAALLARFAFEKRGNQAFWKLHDALFSSQPKLDDQDLRELAEQQGFAWSQVEAAIGARKGMSKIEESQQLADDFQVRGTPHFFINGRRLVGAQPLASFTGLVDEQLAQARALTERGVPRSKVFAELMKVAQNPPPPQQKHLPPPADAASRGKASAPVVIQVFSDFQCPFCKRVSPTLGELEQEFGGSLRIVWRHLPLPFHPHAQLAAEAAQEALAQRGS